MIQSWVTDRCWVCNGLSVTSGGDIHIEVHHIIPQAYGGTDGPTVSLCDTHHTALHKIALALWTNKTYHNLLGTSDPNQVTKLLWLATRVNEARAAVENDPNKLTHVMVPLLQKDRLALDHLMRLHPHIKGRQQMIKYAIYSLYKTHLGS